MVSGPDEVTNLPGDILPDKPDETHEETVARLDEFIEGNGSLITDLEKHQPMEFDPTVDVKLSELRSVLATEMKKPQLDLLIAQLLAGEEVKTDNPQAQEIINNLIEPIMQERKKVENWPK